jgi:hypothetical protein
MLEFFRQYQRIVFIIVTTMVIASFVFFGTFSTFVNEVERPDRLVAQTVQDTPMMLSEVQKLARFIATDREDLAHGHGLPPNFCNDGVIRHDFLRARLAEGLVGGYFDVLKEDFAMRLEKAKRFRPYAHPEAPFLSANAVWDHLLPTLGKEVSALQAESEATPAVFGRFVKLYGLQSQLHPETLRRILVYQHQQYPWLTIDQRLSYEDLALFGFHSVSDWFGRDFVDLVAQFILNAAAVAEAKGYRVSLEEAKGDLVHHFVETVEKLREAKGNPDPNFHHHLRGLGFDENSAAEVWRKVLLFRRYFHDVGEAAFVDRLPFKDFAEYAQETALVQKYEWPVALETAQDLANYRFYVKAVSAPTHGQGAVPSVFLSVEEVEKKYPDLVQTTYRAQVAEIAKKQVGLRASMKEVWAWEVDDKNWSALRSEFSLIDVKGADERVTALRALEPKTLAKIHDKARDGLVDQNPQWVQEALATLPLQEKIWSEKGSQAPVFKTEGAYTRIENLEKVKEKHILPFAQARDVLTKLAGVVEGKATENPFTAMAADALVDLKKNPTDPKWIQSGSDPLRDQFKFRRKEETIPRTSQENWMKEQAFEMLPDLWSPIHVEEGGEIAFFYLQEKRSNPAPILEQLDFGKETLASDAKRYVADRLLQAIQQKKAIVIPVQRGDNESI